MPYQDPDPVDPMTLHGVVFETQDAQAVREMAECFVEEYFRLGFDARRVLQLFRTQGYAGPRLALEVLGEQTIAELVQACARRWGPRAGRLAVDVNRRGDVMLPVLVESITQQEG